MTDRDPYKELTDLVAQYPDLVFDSIGYQELSPSIVEANQEGIDKVSEVLEYAVHGFVRFQNFKPRKDGTIAVRCQTVWDRNFTGVSYFPLENFKQKVTDKDKIDV